MTTLKEVSTVAGNVTWDDGGNAILDYDNPLFQGKIRGSITIKNGTKDKVFTVVVHTMGGLTGRTWLNGAGDVIRIDPGKTGVIDNDAYGHDVSVTNFEEKTVENAPGVPNAPGPIGNAAARIWNTFKAYLPWIIALIVIIVVLYAIMSVLKNGTLPFVGPIPKGVQA